LGDCGPFGLGSFTRAGYARPSIVAIRPSSGDYSHWLRRNTRNNSRQATVVRASSVAKP
jgi:hypothetical protein